MHDKNGTLLRAGDRVMIECVIDTVTPNVDYCNVSVRTLEPMFPTMSPTSITLNARQVVLSERGPVAVADPEADRDTAPPSVSESTPDE